MSYTDWRIKSSSNVTHDFYSSSIQFNVIISRLGISDHSTYILSFRTNLKLLSAQDFLEFVRYFFRDKLEMVQDNMLLLNTFSTSASSQFNHMNLMHDKANPRRLSVDRTIENMLIYILSCVHWPIKLYRNDVAKQTYRHHHQTCALNFLYDRFDSSDSETVWAW